MPIEIRKLSESFAAEIPGVNLAHHITDELFAEIYDAFIAHKVVLFRDQDIAPEHQISFTRRFGAPEIMFTEEQRLAGQPEIAILSNEIVDGKHIGVVAAGDYWHSDISFKPETGLATFLYARKLPRNGGDTEFADIEAAYNDLPEETRRRIEGQRGIHTQSKLRNPRTEVTREGGEEYYRALHRNDDVMHPIVRTHPVSGRKGLYVSPRFTIGIEGMNDVEAQKLLDELFAHQIRPEYLYRHKWRPGDFLMWDNRGINHRACGGYAMDDIRLIHRTSTRCEAPIT
jgi:taurine dioxygenase